MPSPIRFLQWNCRSICNTKKEDLLRVINRLKNDVFALSETWLAPNNQFLLPGFVVIRKDLSNPAANGIFYGGVLLAVKNNIYRNTITVNTINEVVG